MLIPIVEPGVSSADDAEKRGKAVLSASFEKKTAKVGEIVRLVLRYRLPAGSRLPKNPEIRGLKGLTILPSKKSHSTYVN